MKKKTPPKKAPGLLIIMTCGTVHMQTHTHTHTVHAHAPTHTGFANNSVRNL